MTLEDLKKAMELSVFPKVSIGADGKDPWGTVKFMDEVLELERSWLLHLFACPDGYKEGQEVPYHAFSIPKETLEKADEGYIAKRFLREAAAFLHDLQLKRADTTEAPNISHAKKCCPEG